MPGRQRAAQDEKAQSDVRRGGQDESTPAEARGLVSRFGSVEIDWPRTVGYYGGVALAVGLEIIDWPVGLFIAAVPLLKMLNHPKSPLPTRVVAQTLEGAAIPVGGESESTVRILPPQTPQESRQEQAEMANR
jgi:hypothetical protein